jgi:hypothetical protein
MAVIAGFKFHVSSLESGFHVLRSLFQRSISPEGGIGALQKFEKPAERPRVRETARRSLEILQRGYRLS